MIEELALEEYKEVKAQTVARLRALREDVKMWQVVDELDTLVGGSRLRGYIESCAEHPDEHNLYELLALPRFAKFLSKYLFFPSMVARVVRFAEALPQPTGKGRSCVCLTPVQLFQYASIYGFYRKNGKRLTREALLFVPRKYGKTTTAATMALYDALFGEADAEAYITANSLDQAGICFNMVRSIVKVLKKGASRCFREVADTINIHLPQRDTLVRCLPDNPRSLDGLKASLNVNDESSQAVSFATKNTVTTSMGPRPNPLTVDITTASDLIEGPFVSQLNNFKQILLGKVDNDTVFSHIFQPDLWDADNDPATWRKVNPHIGVTVDVDFYAGEYEKALRDYENMIAFKTKLLNLFVCGSAKSWITSDEVWACFRDWDIDAQDVLKEMYYATCSFDLSIRDDFSAVTYLVKLDEEGSIHSHTDYYFPEGCLERHPNSELYRRWADEGFLTLTPGDVIDYSYIVSDILRRTDKVAIVAIGYDGYRSGEMVNSLKSAMPATAKVLKPVSQVRSTFTSPTDMIEFAIAQKKISFSRNPITAWCFQNAVIDEDNNGNRKPMKRYKASSLKIDGAITNLMCLKLWEMLEVSMS